MTFLFPIENHSQKLFISICIVFTILPVTAVVLRMMARKKVGKQPDLSDKVMMGAVVSYWSLLPPIRICFLFCLLDIGAVSWFLKHDVYTEY